METYDEKRSNKLITNMLSRYSTNKSHIHKLLMFNNYATKEQLQYAINYILYSPPLEEEKKLGSLPMALGSNGNSALM